jgi:uncharacterized protein involved in exopolysaccharide biosynthesis
MQEEIDLTKYVMILVRRWWVIIGIALGCTAVVGAAILLRPKPYQARALVAMIKSTWQVSFNTAIKTLSEGDTQVVVDQRKRQASYVELVSSPTVAETVLQKVGEKLPAGERDIASLLTMVQGGLAKDSDSIEIIATHRDPEVAIAVVNAWGQEYAHQVNALYGNTEGESYSVVRSEVQGAKAHYDEAEAALETLLKQDRLDELNRQIAEYQYAIQTLVSARGAVVPTLLNEISRIDRALHDALVMREQVQEGGAAAAASNETALVLLKAQLYANGWGQGAQSQPMGAFPQVQTHPMDRTDGSSSASVRSSQNQPLAPVTLQVQQAPLALQVQASLAVPRAAGGSAMTTEEMTADLGALVATLEKRRGTLTEELRSVSESTAKGEEGWFLIPGTAAQGNDVVDAQLAATIRDLEQRVRELRSQLAREESRLQEVKAQRDLAWQSYDTLSRKEAELAIAAQTTGAQVRFAVPAAVSQKSANGTGYVAIAAVAGLLCGIVAAYALEFRQSHLARAGATGAGRSA